MELENKEKETVPKSEVIPRRELSLPASIFVEAEHDDRTTYRRQNDCCLLSLCILAVLGAFPIGTLALYYLHKAKKEFSQDNIPRARTYGLYAQYLSLIAILLGMVWIGLVIGLTVSS